MSPPVRQPLVGREGQLRQLDAVLATVAEGHVRAAVVAGDAGVGKSRLMAEFLRGAPQTRQIVSHCLPIGSDGVPYAPFAGVLRALVAALGARRLAELAGPGVGELARLSPALGPPGPETVWGKGRLMEAFARLLEALGADEPTILVFEDMHWSDASTRDLLRYLTASLSGGRILFVLTYRTDELPRHHPLGGWLAEYERSHRVSRVDLDPLPGEALASIVAHRHSLPESSIAEIVALSQGVPFYAEELGDAYAAGDRRLPTALRNALTARVYRLSEQARDVVLVASAAATPIPHNVLREATGTSPEEAEAAVAEAVDAGVLAVDRLGRYVFRHALTREALVDDLLPGRRLRVHAGFAAAMEREGCGPAAEVARHWMLAHEDRPAAAWNLRAADDARAVYAHEDELRHLERLLELPERIWPTDVGVRADLLARAADAAVHAGFQERARDLLNEALAEIGPDDAERLVDLTIARVRLPLVQVSIGDLQQLIPRTEPGSRPRAMLLAIIAAGHMVNNDISDGLPAAATALAAAEEFGDLTIVSHVHNTLGCLLLSSGDDAGFEHLALSHRLATESGSRQDQLRYYVNASAQLLELGRYPDAVDVAREGREFAASHGLVSGPGAFLTWQEADALFMLGRWDEALEECERSLRGRPAEGAVPHLLWIRAMVAVRRGQPGGAAIAEQVEQHLVVVADRRNFVLPRAQLAAEMAAAADDVGGALQIVRRASDHGPDATADHAPAFAVLWACLLRMSGGSAAQDAQLTEFLGTLEAKNPTWKHLAAALLDDEESAWRALLDGLQERQGPIFAAALLRLLHADALLREGRRGEARAEVRTANAIIASLGAEVFGAWRRRLVVATSAGSRAELAGREGLTPREAEVLELIARGMSNKEIAQTLFISVKTASIHVSNILAKLGAPSRTQAAAQWHGWQ